MRTPYSNGMPHALLTRRTLQTRPALTVMDGLDLTLARVHEICGRARRSMAMMVASRITGPVFWIAPAWGSDPLNPDGIRAFAPPQQFTFLSPRRPEDVLWAMEEILRSGAVPFVVADLPAPPALTPVRRLHLSAESGMETGPNQPLGLLLTPGEGGAPGVESRWKIEPQHQDGKNQWQLDRLRARTAPQKRWMVQIKEKGPYLAPTDA